MRPLWIISLIPILFSSCYEEIQLDETDPSDTILKVLSVNHIDGFVDEDAKLILFTLPSDTITSFNAYIHFYQFTSISFAGIELQNDEVNDLGEISTGRPYELIAFTQNLRDTFEVVFTPFPLIQISCGEEITDEPKVLCSFKMQYFRNTSDDKNIYSFTSLAGIEVRGATSMRYNKVSYGTELWKNNAREDYSAALLGMRLSEDWILDAMYVDKLRMRNKLSFELWEKISRVPEADNKPILFPGSKCRFIELFINNSYKGIYSMNERLDDKLLDFPPEEHSGGGALYKATEWGNGATRFNAFLTPPPKDYYWDGWEQIYPSTYPYWEPLDTLRKFILESSDEEFRNRIAEFIDLDNAASYYLFMNMILANDNSGKNTFLAKYSKESTFFIVPWDLEASWGLVWNGERIGPGGIVSNNLYDRLKTTDSGGFNANLLALWSAYRKDQFSEETLLKNVGEYYSLLMKSGAISREQVAWENIEIDLQEEYEYICEWIRERLEFLDNYFGIPLD